MEIRELSTKEKEQFNKLATHPLQSWEWGDFRQKMGIKVLRLGRFDEKKTLKEIAQVTFHPVPFTSFTVGYFPKGNVTSNEMFKALVDEGFKNKTIFIKIEPNVLEDKLGLKADARFTIIPSSYPLFTKYTFLLDLTKSEDELLNNLHPKTRYNIRVAQKHEVYIKEDNSDKAFEEYLRLTFETTKRQKFYAHDEKYHRTMWKTLSPSGIAHLLTASYKGEILVTWIVFLFNQALYYPYGASTNKFRNVMASNLMMWEAIKWGRKNGAKFFDMWGSLGPNPNASDPWYGFHKFKEGYKPELITFIGSYDLVINNPLYKTYNLTYSLRQLLLRLKSYF